VTDDGLADISATEALVRFASKDLSPRDLFAAVADRITTGNATIKAFGDIFLEEAGREAEQAERRWLNGDARPLEGILVAVKDAQRVAGQRTTFGSPFLRNNVASADDPMIERLRAAGAIFHARTTVSEFCISGVCTSPMWGTTRNPWHRDYSPGGSSGGSAAGLAAGMTTLATGTDMGSSIRVPASACGIIGYKPPRGRVPHGPPFNLDRLDHCGPLARRVADIAIVQNVVSGPHPADIDSLPDPPALPTQAGNVCGLRVGWSVDLSYRRVSEDVAANTRQAVRSLRDLGCPCEEGHLGWTDETDEAASAWLAFFGTSAMLLEALAREPSSVSPDLRRLGEHLRRTRQNPKLLPHVFRTISAMNAGFERVMTRFDVFVCPTMAVPAVKADQSMWAEDFGIEGVNVDPEWGYSMTHPFNLLCTCPVISVPSGLSKEGLPTGIQVVGSPFDEHSVFRLALAYEAAIGPFPCVNATFLE